MKSFWVKVITAALQSLFSASVLASELPAYDVREELDKNGDGQADCFVYKKDDVKVMEEIDSNFDGTVDMRRIYNSYGKVIRSQVIARKVEQKNDDDVNVDITDVTVEPRVGWNNGSTQ